MGLFDPVLPRLDYFCFDVAFGLKSRTRHTIFYSGIETNIYYSRFESGKANMTIQGLINIKQIKS